MGVKNIITFDAHDPRLMNAVPLMSFDNAMPTYQVLKNLLKKKLSRANSPLPTKLKSRKRPKKSKKMKMKGLLFLSRANLSPISRRKPKRLLKRIIPPPMPPRAKNLLRLPIRCMRSAKRKVSLRSNLLMSSMKQVSSLPLMQFPKKTPPKRSIRLILPKIKAISPRLRRPKVAKFFLLRSLKKLFPRLQKISHRSKRFGSTVLLLMQKRSKALLSICA